LRLRTPQLVRTVHASSPAASTVMPRGRPMSWISRHCRESWPPRDIGTPNAWPSGPLLSTAVGCQPFARHAPDAALRRPWNGDGRPGRSAHRLGRSLPRNTRAPTWPGRRCRPSAGRDA
jgi:hypothetical protein